MCYLKSSKIKNSETAMPTFKKITNIKTTNDQEKHM